MMNREQRMELLRDTQRELAEAQRQVVHLQQVVDGLTGLLGPRDSAHVDLNGFRQEVRTRASNADRAIRGSTMSEAERTARRIMANQKSAPTNDVVVMEAKTPPENPIKPRDAILFVMSRSAGIPMTPRQVYRELERRGMVNADYKSGQAAYDTALRRLAEEPASNVSQDDNGAYVYRGPKQVLTRALSVDGQFDFKAQPEGERP
jgi:hypothetical protein